MSTAANIPGVAATPASPSAAHTILTYHQRTKHRADGYARGPETLDWDAQPNPWRVWEGCARVDLPLVSDTLQHPYAVLTGELPVDPVPLGLAGVAALLELSFGLSAWKEAGPDRWALRCNPSSGNLHPTEVYVLASSVPGLADGVHHYDSRAHALERRCATNFSGGEFAGGGLWIGLSSILWRETWKYGERAFRYCQLDIGHALGALRAAALLLGWRVTLVSGMDHAGVADLLGTGRQADFTGAEPEEAELLLAVEASPTGAAGAAWPVRAPDAEWHGRASLLDPHPMYSWPVIDAVAIASRSAGTARDAAGKAPSIDLPVPSLAAPEAPAVASILSRRSAQRYDRAHTMPFAGFARILDAVRPSAESGLYLIAYVHAVEGLDRGIYALAGADSKLRAAFDPDFSWLPVAGFPAGNPLHQLATADCRKLIRALTCHQAITADGCVTFSLLSDFAGLIEDDPAAYRYQHWQAGLLGHALYLEAQAAGLAGTGIGCFMDDEIHRLLGLRDEAIQALYHFTIGKALADARIATVPAYGTRSRAEVSVRG